MGTSSEILCLCMALGLGFGLLNGDWSSEEGAGVARPAGMLVSIPGASTVAGDDGRVFVNAQLNGKPVRFMVDTGATVSILSKADALFAGVNESDVAVNIQGINGMTIGQQVRVGELVLGTTHVRDVRMMVVDGLQHSLLGMDVLRRTGPVEIRFGTAAND